MKENLDDVLSAHNDVVRIERLTHHIARIREGLGDMRRGQDELRASVKQRILNILIALDQLANTLLAGHADEYRTPVQRFPFLSTHRRTLGSNHLAAFPCGIIPVSRLE